MKKLFFILTLVLSVLFAPFILAVNAIQNVPVMPGYQIPVLELPALVMPVNCRDVLHPANMVIIYTDQSIKNPGIIMIMQKTGGSLDEILGTYKNHKGAATLTDKTVFQCWQSAVTYKKDPRNQMTSWPETSFN